MNAMDAMDAKITVSVRGVLLAFVSLVALVVAYVLGGAGQGGAANAAGTPPASPGTHPSITMVGEGTSTAVPDELEFSLQVTYTEPDVSTALHQTNVTLRSVLHSVRAFGVTGRDLRTTGLSIQPTYSYPANGSPVITGYQVTEGAQVTVRQLAQGGKALAAAANAGGNAVRVGSVRLTVANPAAALANARKSAVADATAKAREYAAATGSSLGSVLSIREVAAPSPTPVYAFANSARAAAGKAASVPVRPGRQKEQVQVQVVWSLS